MKTCSVRDTRLTSNSIGNNVEDLLAQSITIDAQTLRLAETVTSINYMKNNGRQSYHGC